MALEHWFEVGDEVITSDGDIGKIVEIRLFIDVFGLADGWTVKVQYEGNGSLANEVISENTLRFYYKIGDRVLGNFGRAKVNKKLQALRNLKHEYYSAMRAMRSYERKLEILLKNQAEVQ